MSQSRYATAGMVPAIVAAVLALTFSKDIAPIIWTRCATCHRPGGIAPFSLLTYADVKQRATLIRSLTARRIMPPWKPEPGKGDFAGARRLTDSELAALQQWIAAGAREGDPADLPPPPTWNSGWQLGTPDLIVSMPEPFRVPADGTNVFRTFVLPIAISRPRYVRAVEFRPGDARLVHHATLGIDRTQSSRLLDARDPEPGYIGGMVPDARYPDGQLLGWTPGQAAQSVAPGTAWRLEPGSDVVAQLHLQPTGRPEALTISIGFSFTDDPPTRTPVGLRLGSETIDIPPGQRDYAITDTYTTPVDVEIVALQPHAHNLARRMTATATPPDGNTRWLISIADWDFRWQDVYRCAQPIVLPKGTILRMQFTYDNSADNIRNPHRPPVRVVWGQNTTDEMGDLWIQMLPRVDADAAALRADVQRKRSGEDLAAYRKLLEADPTNPLRHEAVANLYLDARRLDEAAVHFRRSLELNPASSSSHYNLGYALALQGQRERAIESFRAALRLDPDHAQAHNNLAAMLQLTGRADEAMEHYRRAITLRPDNVEARSNLGRLFSSRRQEREAAEQFRAVLAQREDDPQALAGVAWIAATSDNPSLRDPPEAVRLAARAAALTGRRDLTVLDALAAAYAAADRFDDAIQAAGEGAELAESEGRLELSARFRERAALYRQRRRDR
jgi:tetratricopeptide (TPR) repeat protein